MMEREIEIRFRIFMEDGWTTKDIEKHLEILFWKQPIKSTLTIIERMR